MKQSSRPSETFPLEISELRSIVAQAVSGGDFADLFFQDKTISSLSMRDSSVSAGSLTRETGCGVRVLCGEKTGYAYTEDLDYKSILTAAKAAGAICECSANIGPFQAVEKKSNNFYPMQKDWRTEDPSTFAPFLLELDRRLRAADPRVVKVMANLSYSISEVMIYNSLDELSSDIRPMGSVGVNVIFQSGGRTESRYTSRSFRMGAELLSERTMTELTDKVTANIDDLFAATRPAGGQMSVVMGRGASGILLHEAMGHSFEADFNRKGQSVFSGRIGEQVCKKGINIVDDATIPYNRGSVNVDDEGVPGQKTYMVQDGILTSYLHDRISARYFNVAPTGNGRREDFRYEPIPRMRATYMESGTDGTCQDLIESVRKGVYVDEFANGEVKIGEGDFTFYVKSGYLIENGRLTQPIKDINIIGNGPKALADISAVASDLEISDGTWVCGKGQSVAVSCGIPSVLINNLTVGGQ